MASTPAVAQVEAGAPADAAAQEGYSPLRRKGRWKDALRRRMLALADLLAWVVGGAAASLAFGAVVRGRGAY